MAQTTRLASFGPFVMWQPSLGPFLVSSVMEAVVVVVAICSLYGWHWRWRTRSLDVKKH